jgi:hypothetical protein
MIGTALAIGQGLYGAYNAIKAGQEAKDYQAKMERMARQSPLKTESPEIANYYGESLNRYNENPFTSPYYLEQIKQANRASVNAIGQAQNRGAAIGIIGKVNQGLIDSSNNAIARAIQNKNAQFSQLGSAAQMRKNERDQLFDINQMTPYNRILQLQQLKTQAANDRYNAGLSMSAQGASNLAQLDVAKQMYPDGVKKDSTGKGLFDFFNFKNKNTPSANATTPTYPLVNNLPAWKGFNLPVWDPSTGTYKNK